MAGIEYLNEIRLQKGVTNCKKGVTILGIFRFICEMAHPTFMNLVCFEKVLGTLLMVRCHGHIQLCSVHTHTTLQTAASSSIIFSTRSKKVFSAGYPPFSLLNLFIWQLIVQVQTNPSNESVLIFQLFVKHSSTEK